MSAVVLRQAEARPDGSTASLALLANFINEAAGEYLLAGRRSLECARRAGVFLVQAKALLGHGHFCDFVRERCEFSHDTACRFMRLATKYRDEDKFQKIRDMTISEALRMAAGDADEEPPPARDERQALIFSAEDAPMPTDAASRLLAAGVPVDGESERGRKFRLLILHLGRERLWGSHAPEALVRELDARALCTLEEGAPAWIAWFGELLAAARNERAGRPSLAADEAPRRITS